MFAIKNQHKQVTPLIREFISGDLDSIKEIELLSFDDPWTAKDFARIVFPKKQCSTIVAELCDTVVGYIIYEQRLRCIEIFNMAVAPHIRRRGIGRELVRSLQFTFGRTVPIHAITIDKNLEAQLFFRSMDF